MSACDYALHVAHGVEQPLTLTVEKSFDVAVIVCSQRRHFDVAGRDDNSPLRCRRTPAKLVRDLGTANANSGHQAAPP